LQERAWLGQGAQRAVTKTEGPVDAGFSGTQAAKVVGITYRQLDYWARTDLIRPSLTDASGSGSRRRYSYKDLLELRVIKTLLDAGIKLESVRDVFEYMREHVDSDIASAHLVISGNSVMLADGDELIDVLRNGQGVLNVLSLASVKQEVDDQLPKAVELPGVSGNGSAGHRVTR
jgi:DNA-binding transcriptional MerR regulator